MANLEAKFTELQAQISTQHNATIAALAGLQSSLTAIANNTLAASNTLNLIEADISIIAPNVATVRDNTATASSVLAFIRNILTGSYTVSNPLLELSQFVAGSQYLALSDIATSNNGNNSILAAISANNGTMIAHLARIALCSCNGGEPVPVPIECEGDYRQHTITSYQGVGFYYFTVNLQDTSFALQRIVTSIANENSYSGVTTLPDGTDYGCDVPGIFRVEYGKTICIENRGTKEFFVYFATDGSANTTWNVEQIEPGGYTGGSSNTQGQYTYLGVGSSYAATNPDAFKPLFFVGSNL